MPSKGSCWPNCAVNTAASGPGKAPSQRWRSLQLSSSASALINAGEHLVQEGQDMQEYADQLLRSIGR